MPNHSQFTDGEIDGVVLTDLTSHADDRGWLLELFRSDETSTTPAMGYLSETNPGIQRGPHEHKHQTDHFVVMGEGEFEFCLWDDRKDSPTAGKRMIVRAGGKRPLRVSVPPGVVHAYKNVSQTAAQLMNFPDKLYAGENRSEPVDEIRHEQSEDHPFHW